LKILEIPFMLRENPFSFLATEEPAPRIIGTAANFNSQDLATLLSDDATFDIKVEQEIVAHCHNFFEAFSTMLACYYVFNVAYPKNLEGTLTFFQKFILNIGDDQKTLPRVAGLISRLKKIVN